MEGRPTTEQVDSMKTSVNRSRIHVLQLLLSVGVLISPLLPAGAAVQIEDTKRVSGSGLGVHISEDTDTPNAVLIAFQGKCTYSVDGTNFTRLEAKDVFAIKPIPSKGKDSTEAKIPFIFTQGAIVRTEEDSRVDIFFRRVGTKVRLQPGTEVRFEKMERHMEGGQPVMATLLDLRKGRLFIAVRSPVPGSTFEIRNAAGRSVVEGGGGKGRYIVTADGTHVTEKGSAAPFKVFGESGVTVIAPGMKFSGKDGKMLPLEAPEAVKLLIEFDELDSLAEQEATPDAPAGKH